MSGRPSEVRGGVHHLWIYVHCEGGTDSVDRDLVKGLDQADVFVGDEESVAYRKTSESYQYRYDISKKL